MMRLGATFQCDGCGAIQHVDPREFIGPSSDEERILDRHYGWHVRDPHHGHNTGLHFCPKCAAGDSDAN
jgi:hypothetical protein